MAQSNIEPVRVAMDAIFGGDQPAMLEGMIARRQMFRSEQQALEAIEQG